MAKNKLEVAQMIIIGDLEAYDVQEVAKKLKISVYTVRKYLKEGSLKGKKVGGHWYVTQEALKNFILPKENKNA
jgi:excisionase family DNA binding protein